MASTVALATVSDKHGVKTKSSKGGLPGGSETAVAAAAASRLLHLTRAPSSRNQVDDGRAGGVYVSYLVQ